MFLSLYTRAQTTWFGVRERFSREGGATAAEYGLLVALIAAVIIAGATLLGGAINTKLTDVGNSVSGA